MYGYGYEVSADRTQGPAFRQAPTEHPKAADLRRSNLMLICMFLIGAAVLGVLDGGF